MTIDLTRQKSLTQDTKMVGYVIGGIVLVSILATVGKELLNSLFNPC